MELNLTGKVAVISGGGTGIGKALALEYLKEGVQVCTFGLTPDGPGKICAGVPGGRL